MNKYTIPGVIALVVIVGLSAYGVKANSARTSDDAMKKEEAMKKETATPDQSEAMMMQHKKEQETMAMTKDAGAAYITYTTEADAQKLITEHGKDVVYFFSATWCPDCQALEKNLTNASDLAKLGKNTVIVKVDYDTQSALKNKYAITHQTAFVRIDAQGNSVKKAVLSSDYQDVISF
jgi:thioredoxin 1